MTDKDAVLLRTFIAKYGFDGILLELIRIAQAYSRMAHGSRWPGVTRSLQGAHIQSTGKVKYEDELDFDANESGAPIRARKEVQATAR